MLGGADSQKGFNDLNNLFSPFFFHCFALVRKIIAVNFHKTNSSRKKKQHILFIVCFCFVCFFFCLLFLIQMVFIRNLIVKL